MKKLIFIMLALVCFTACTNDDENGLEITGDWDDNIGLSTKSVTLNGAGEPVTIKTEGKNWWIATIKVDGEILYNFIEDGTENRNMYQTGLFNLKCGWLKVNVEDWTLSISADMNEDLGGGWVTYGIGAQFRLGDQAYAYGELERTSGGDVVNPYLFNVGLRWNF